MRLLKLPWSKSKGRQCQKTSTSSQRVIEVQVHIAYKKKPGTKDSRLDGSLWVQQFSISLPNSISKKVFKEEDQTLFAYASLRCAIFEWFAKRCRHICKKIEDHLCGELIAIICNRLCKRSKFCYWNALLRFAKTLYTAYKHYIVSCLRLSSVWSWVIGRIKSVSNTVLHIFCANFVHGQYCYKSAILTELSCPL